MNCTVADMPVAIDVQRAWTDGGIKTLLTRSLKRLVRPAFKVGKLGFTECDLRKPLPERRPVPGIAIREATLGDVELFKDRELFFQRIGKGYRCFMGIEEATGKLANYRWVSTSTAY